MHIVRTGIRLHQEVIVLPVAAHKSVSPASVAALIKAEDPHILFSYHGRAGAVPKQHTGASVRPVHDPGQRFRSQDKGILKPSRTQEGIRRLQGKQEAGAGRIDIKGHSLCGAKTGLQFTGCRRGHMICRNRRRQNQIQILRSDPRFLHCQSGCLLRHVRGGFLSGNPSFPDSGTAGYPFIRCIHFGGKPVICYPCCRKAASCPYYSAPHLFLHAAVRECPAPIRQDAVPVLPPSILKHLQPHPGSFPPFPFVPTGRHCSRRRAGRFPHPLPLRVSMPP